MKFTDYKFWYIKRNDDGFMTEAAVRFYDGEYQIIEGKEVYKRIKRLSVLNGELNHLADKDGNIGYTHEANEKDAVIFLPRHFGKIKTDDELRDFLNKEIAKDKGRKLIKEQELK
mgnify:FL=1